MNETLTVEPATALDDELVDAVRRLLPQLSSSAVFAPELVAQLIDSDATTLYVARDDGAIVGMSTLVVYALPTGLRAHIDDVVVDGAHRGKGIARALLTTMLAEAERREVRTVDLTSRPTRVAAIHLYESVGFRHRETTLLRYTPGQS